MMIAGTIYGVVLNDHDELESLAPAFDDKPYGAPPRAPVVYIKPRSCLAASGAIVHLPTGASDVSVAATLALSFARDVTGIDAQDAWSALGAVSLAMNISMPQDNYYRPAIRQQCRDGFLPLGTPVAPRQPSELVTYVDDVEVHRWSFDRLARPVESLVRDLSAFMTLRGGDLLLVGLPGDAPRVRPGQIVRAESPGFASLVVHIETERLS